jgi:Kef-type K+ transport system membrane component KefB
MSPIQIFELQFFLLLAIIIVASKVAGDLSRRWLRQPVVFGEILIGVLLGPSLLNIFGWGIFQAPSPAFHDLLPRVVELLASFGVLLLMFVAGLETDVEQLRRVGKTAFWTAVAGVVFPLGLGLLTARGFGLNMREAVFIGAVLTATSVSISAQTLIELGALASREGMTILGAAVIDDVLGILILSFVVAFSGMNATGNSPTLADRAARLLAGGHAPVWLSIVMIVVLMAAFFVVAGLIGKYGVRPLLNLAARLHASYALAATAVVLMLLFAVGAEYIGQVAAITGAYLLGVFVSRAPQLEKVLHALHPFIYAVFVPIFFMSIGLGTDLRHLSAGLGFTVAIIAVALITKIAGCGLGARWSGFTGPEALRVGVGMISRGEVGLIVAQVGFAAAIIRQAEYAALVLMVLVSTAVTPLLLRLVFPRAAARERDIYESVVTVETDSEEQQD